MPDTSPYDPAGSILSFPSAVDPEPDMLLLHQQQLAQKALDELLAGLSPRLVGYFCSPISLRSAGIRQGRGSKFAPDESVGCTVELEIDPVPGFAFVHLGRDFASAALASLLGTPEHTDEMPREALSEVDLHILEGLLGVITGELKAAWEPLFGVAFRPRKPVLQQALSGSQGHGAVELCAEITLRNTPGLIRIVMPSVLVRLAAERAGEPAFIAVASPEESLASALEGASLRVETVMPGTDIRIRDLLLLKPGAILQLPVQASMPVECRVNGIATFAGDLVASGDSFGFQIKDLLIVDEAV